MRVDWSRGGMRVERKGVRVERERGGVGVGRESGDRWEERERGGWGWGESDERVRMSRENGERKRWDRVRVGKWCESGERKGVRVGIE